MAQVNFRMDDGLKAQAEAEFKRMGLTFSAAIALMCTQVVIKHRLPFPIETIEANIGGSSFGSARTSRGDHAEAERFRAFAAANTIKVPADFKWSREDATAREMRCLA